jgi:hypothetical protein
MTPFWPAETRSLKASSADPTASAFRNQSSAVVATQLATQRGAYEFFTQKFAIQNYE